MVPPGAGGTLAPVARQLAGAAEAELEHGLQAVGAHLAQLPTSDLSAAVIQRVHAGNANPSGHGNALSSSTAVGGTVAIAVVLVVLILGHQPPTSAQPPPTPVAAAPSAASPTPTAVRQVTVLGADLDPAGRAEVQQLLDVQPETQVQTLDRGDVLSTLTAAGLSANPSDPVLSSVSLHCPGQTPGLQVHMTHITGLAPLTFATALLVVAAPDASVDIAAPAAQPVSGESAVVGMLQAIGDCSGQDPRSAARVSLGYALIQRTEQLTAQLGDPAAAATVLSDAVQAIVTQRATDQTAVETVISASVQAAHLSLDPSIRHDIAAALLPLVGQDYGSYAAGYQVHVTPDSAQLTR